MQACTRSSFLWSYASSFSLYSLSLFSICPRPWWSECQRHDLLMVASSHRPPPYRRNLGDNRRVSSAHPSVRFSQAIDQVHCATVTPAQCIGPCGLWGPNLPWGPTTGLTPHITLALPAHLHQSGLREISAASDNSITKGSLIGMENTFAPFGYNALYNILPVWLIIKKKAWYCMIVPDISWQKYFTYDLPRLTVIT